MKLLLDTHALLWWLAEDKKLSPTVRWAISDESNPVCVSAASAWEISTKHRLGKLPKAGPLVTDLAGVVVQQGFLELAISLEDAQRAGALVGSHKDPFDRMLIAQARLRDFAMISNEEVFDTYGVIRLW